MASLTQLGVDTDNTHETAQHALGSRAAGRQGEEFVYAQASGAISASYAAIIEGANFQAKALTKTLLDANEAAPIGWPQVAVADDEYAWFQTDGAADIRVNASAGAKAELYTTTTAGQLDDAASGHTKIQRVRLTTARGGSAGTAPAFLNHPAGE